MLARVVTWDNGQETEGPFLWRERAEQKFNVLNKLGAKDVAIKFVAVDDMPNQKVEVSGDVAGFQFSRTTMGKRTERRMVTNIHKTANGLEGQVEWKGRVLRVVQGDWFKPWVAVERVGWKD